MNFKPVGMICSALVISFCMLASASAAPNDHNRGPDSTQHKQKYEHRVHDKNPGNGAVYKNQYNSKHDNKYNNKHWSGKRYEICKKDNCDTRGVHEHNNKKFVGKKGNYHKNDRHDKYDKHDNKGKYGKHGKQHRDHRR